MSQESVCKREEQGAGVEIVVFFLFMLDYLTSEQVSLHDHIVKYLASFSWKLTAEKATREKDLEENVVRLKHQAKVELLLILDGRIFACYQ